MKTKEPKIESLRGPCYAAGSSLTFLGALCAAGSGGAQDAVSDDSESEAENTLPTQVVDAADPAPAPRPVPRPAPAPVAAPAPVVAPEPEPEPLIIDDAEYKVDRLSTTKYTQPLLDVPQTVQVIPEELIEDQGATTLRDALRNVSGISIQAGEGGDPAGDNLSIRGFTSRTDIFVDGIRDFGAYTRDPFNLEQVEVSKGPASSNYGRGSAGGSINLVSKTPRIDDFTNVDLSVGTDDLFRGTLDVNSPIEAIPGSAMRLNIMGHNSDAPGRDYIENDRFGVAGALAFGLGEPKVVGSGKNASLVTIPNDTRLYTYIFHLEENNVPDYGIPWVPDNIADPTLIPFINQPAPVSRDNFYGNLNRDFEDTSTTIGTVRLEHDFNDSLTFQNQFRAGKTDRFSIVSAPRFVTGSNPARIRGDDWKDRDQVNSILANQTELLFKFDTGPIYHQGLVGYEFVHEEDVRHRLNAPDSVTLDLYNPDPRAPFVAGAPAIGRTGDYTQAIANTNSVYLFDTAEVTEWLEFTGGFRHDRFELDYLNSPLGGPVVNLNRVDNLTSGRAAVVFKPADNGSVYFGWGTAFNPSGEELTLSDGTGRGGANFDVDPEMSETYELGTKWEILDRRLRLSGALFQTDKTNARTTDPVDPLNQIVLLGEQRVSGFELGAAGAITPWWEIYGSFTHLDSEVLSSLDPTEIGNELPNTPHNSFSLWSQVDLPGGFFVGGGPVFVDSRFNNVSNERVAPSYTTWDALIGYEVNENLTLRLNIHNLADEEYIGRVGGGHVIPGEGRWAMFTASMKF